MVYQLSQSEQDRSQNTYKKFRYLVGELLYLPKLRIVILHRIRSDIFVEETARKFSVAIKYTNNSNNNINKTRK